MLEDSTEMPDPATLARQGVDACRREEWDEGLRILGELINGETAPELPSVAYSYLGYGIAEHEKKYREGVALCDYAVNIDICEPENYFNVARAHMLTGNRQQAVGMLNRGLALAPSDDKLVELRLSLGVRKPPVIRFLSRDNVLNQIFGRLRHRLRKA